MEVDLTLLFPDAMKRKKKAEGGDGGDSSSGGGSNDDDSLLSYVDPLSNKYPLSERWQRYCQ